MNSSIPKYQARLLEDEGQPQKTAPARIGVPTLQTVAMMVPQHQESFSLYFKFLG